MAADGTVVVDLEDDSPTITQDQLLFQDIPHTELSSTGESSVSGLNKTRPQNDKVQTHTFTDFPRSNDSDEEDKADLLEGNKKQASFWTFEYYQSFFDVDTKHVVRRIVGSMYPNPRANYLQTHIRPHPDLYGPWWICVTLVFTTAVAGNLSNYLWIHSAQTQFEWKYDFHKVTLAATAIFSYWWLVPSVVYCVLWWRGNPAGFTYTELICVYGYTLAVYIPVSILCVIQYIWLQWLLVITGMVLSGAVLVLTMSPAFRNDNKQIFFVTMAFVVAMHVLLAVVFKLYFFDVVNMSDSVAAASTTLSNSTLSVTTSYLPPPTL